MLALGVVKLLGVANQSVNMGSCNINKDGNAGMLRLQLDLFCVFCQANSTKPSGWSSLTDYLLFTMPMLLLLHHLSLLQNEAESLLLDHEIKQLVKAFALAASHPCYLIATHT